ncbi:MAG: M56 family metallopeptidase [Clostridia bacterium]|nr:M56 family metallopeptidase [Clostridia bacterium]
MKELFLSLVNISITAGYLILAAVLLRLLLRKAPKWIRGILWALVGVRLIFPFSLKSAVSLIPSAETVPQSVLAPGGVPAITSGFPAVDGALNPVLSAALESTADAGVPLWRTLAERAWIVWLAGLGLMLFYAVITTARIRRSVREAVPGEEKGVWLCDAVRSPFILGVIRPRIYLPSLPLGGETESYLIAHEKAHLKRGDHLWKPLGFMLLCVYWFNPLCWLAYVLLCRDIELACDERVIRDLDRGQIADYSEALLRFSVPRRRIAACPLAFGEVGVKTRIRSALSYKKPAFWIVIIALLACAAAAVCLLTDPEKKKTDPAELAVSLQALTDGQRLWGGGTFPYLQAVLDGEIDYNAPKLDEETIREIIKENGGIGESGKPQNGDFEGILADIAAIQAYPDYQAATVSERVTMYWGNEQKGKMLIIHEPGIKENRSITLCDYFRVDHKDSGEDGLYRSTVYPYTAEILYGSDSVGAYSVMTPLGNWGSKVRP